jgi:transposase
MLILKRWAASKTVEVRLSERADYVLKSIEGLQDSEIASLFRTRPNTVAKWRKRFISLGTDGLYDDRRPGRPPKYPVDETLKSILELLGQTPPKGQAAWDGNAVAKELGINKNKVWQILRQEGIHLQRQRTWCVSTDPMFAVKAADIVGLYLDPPEKALVLSVDEKPSIQAAERPSGYVMTKNHQIVRGIKSACKRHGAVNLFAALEIAAGALKTKAAEKKQRVDFLEFMDQTVTGSPEDAEVHVILDNYCTHKKCDEWLDRHENVFFHFTQTPASWLNMVEIWFGIFSRKALKSASFKSTSDLTQAISEFVEAYNENSEPFVWKKRDVRGSQLRNTIANLSN